MVAFTPLARCRSEISVLLRIVVNYYFLNLPLMDIDIVAVLRTK
jgi:hypothetical protein